MTHRQVDFHDLLLVKPEIQHQQVDALLSGMAGAAMRHPIHADHCTRAAFEKQVIDDDRASRLETLRQAYQVGCNAMLVNGVIQDHDIESLITSQHLIDLGQRHARSGGRGDIETAYERAPPIEQEALPR